MKESKSGKEWVLFLAQSIYADKCVVISFFICRYSFAICWYIVTLIGAIYLPDFDLASKVIGSMAALLIFVFPGLALIVTYVERKLYRAILGTCFATLGVFLFFYSLLTAFY